MSWEQACRKRSKKARRLERDALGRFCSAGRSPPPPISPESSASQEITSAAERLPEAIVGMEIRSPSERALRAFARREIRSTAERAPKASARRGLRSSSSVVPNKKLSSGFSCSARIILCDEDGTPDVQGNKTIIELLTSSSSEECTIEEGSSKDSLVSPAKQKEKEKGKERKMTFKELHDEVAASHDNINSLQVQLYKGKAKKKNKSQDNIEWLHGELYKEKAKKKRLQDALIAVSEKARNNN